MALNISRQLILNGTSRIDKEVVMTLNATLPNDTGVANINQYIQNTELYDANRQEVREDVRAFQDEVYRLEDELKEQNEEESE